MADIRRYALFRHLRSEPSFHVLRHRRGSMVGSGRGLSFFFVPIWTSVAEIPMDDRDLPILFHGRSRDYQDIVVQGVITYRVTDPEVLGERVDFTVDLTNGVYLHQPLDQIATLLTGLAQQAAIHFLAGQAVRQLLESGVGPIRERIESVLKGAGIINLMGLEIISLRVTDLKPSTELETALQTPTREKIQEAADKAIFERRAQAVEEERAIAENELTSKIELATREERLIEQRGKNEQRRAGEEAEAKLIETKAGARRQRIDSQARAEGIRAVEEARVYADRERMAIYRDLAPSVLLGLAARELAGKLESIEHVNISPDQISTALAGLLEAGSRRLAGNTGE